MNGKLMAVVLALALGAAAQRPAPVILAATPACAQLREIAAHNPPDWYFAVALPSPAVPHPRWRERGSPSVPADAAEVAVVWARGGRVRYVAITRGLAAGGIEYDDYCFDRKGALRYMREEVRSPERKLFAVRERGFSPAGQPTGEERHFFRLSDEKPAPVPAAAARWWSAPRYRRVAALPFARSLP